MLICCSSIRFILILCLVFHLLLIFFTLINVLHLQIFLGCISALTILSVIFIEKSMHSILLHEKDIAAILHMIIILFKFIYFILIKKIIYNIFIQTKKYVYIQFISINSQHWSWSDLNLKEEEEQKN